VDSTVGEFIAFGVCSAAVAVSFLQFDRLGDAVDEYVIVNELQQRLVVARADLQLRKYLWVSQSIPWLNSLLSKVEPGPEKI
jgi:hypothetical protein